MLVITDAKLKLFEQGTLYIAQDVAFKGFNLKRQEKIGIFALPFNVHQKNR
jgi:hypothetical protein